MYEICTVQHFINGNTEYPFIFGIFFKLLNFFFFGGAHIFEAWIFLKKDLLHVRGQKQ